MRVVIRPEGHTYLPFQQYRPTMVNSIHQTSEVKRMAVNIGTLITGNMAIGSDSGSSGHPETIFTFTDNRTVSLDISGELGSSIWTWDDEVENLIFDYEGSDKLFKYDLISVDIGNIVTSIGTSAFYECNILTNVMIPSTVTSI